MYLLDQKAEDIISKITFAKQTINEIKSPDEVLKSYIEPLGDWLKTLKENVKKAKTDFAEFVKNTGFGQEAYIPEKAHRRLLAAILRNFEDIEKRVYLGVDTFLPLIFVWNSQKTRPETKRHHDLLTHFVNDFLKFCCMPEPVMTIIGESYACLPIEWANKRKHIIFGTFSEAHNLRKFVLLAHEIGHVYYYQNSFEINSNVSPQVVKKLSEVRPPNLDQSDFEGAVYIWTNYWIPEFVSDCFAVKTLGPAFVLQFMLTALNGQPDRVKSTHPPTSIRVNFMLDILEALDLSNVNIDDYRSSWQSYTHTVSTPTSLFIANDDVVNTALNSIRSVLTPTPIIDKWTDITDARHALSSGMIPDQDLISTITALAIEESKIDPVQISNELLKRYPANSNVL
jgi:hypothetical protein